MPSSNTTSWGQASWEDAVSFQLCQEKKFNYRCYSIARTGQSAFKYSYILLEADCLAIKAEVLSGKRTQDKVKSASEDRLSVSRTILIHLTVTMVSWRMDINNRLTR